MSWGKPHRAFSRSVSSCEWFQTLEPSDPWTHDPGRGRGGPHGGRDDGGGWGGGALLTERETERKREREREIKAFSLTHGFHTGEGGEMEGGGTWRSESYQKAWACGPAGATLQCKARASGRLNAVCQWYPSPSPELGLMEPSRTGVH